MGTSGNQESIFLAESSLAEIESIISGDESSSMSNQYSSKSNLLINSWFYISQIFIKIGKLKEAEKCINEIKTLSKGNQSKTLFLRGLIAEAEGDLSRAIRYLNDSISIN